MVARFTRSMLFVRRDGASLQSQSAVEGQNIQVRSSVSTDMERVQWIVVLVVLMPALLAFLVVLMPAHSDSVFQNANAMAQRLPSSHRSRWVRSPRSPGKAHSLGWQGIHKRRFPAMAWSGWWQHVGLGNSESRYLVVVGAAHDGARTGSVQLDDIMFIGNAP